MKNGILTLLFAFIPGAGQMYQGYMKRGLSLITMFCLGGVAYCLLGSLVGTLGVLGAAAMCIVWMYSFFDTFNLRAAIGAGTAPTDDYLVHLDLYDAKMKRVMGESHKLLGWALIALGVIIFYQNVLMNTVGDIVYRWGQNNVFFRALYLVLDSLPEVVVCAAFVVCGIWLVRGPRSAKRPADSADEVETEQKLQPEEFPEYRAAAQSAEDAKDAAGEAGGISLEEVEPQGEEANGDDSSDCTDPDEQ